MAAVQVEQKGGWEEGRMGGWDSREMDREVCVPTKAQSTQAKVVQRCCVYVMYLFVSCLVHILAEIK